MALFIESEKWWRDKYFDTDYLNGNVFHYTSAVALESILKHKKIWVTKSDFLNDKSEYMYTFNLIKSIYKHNKFKNINIVSFNEMIKMCKILLSRSFIFSTSLNSDSINLWSNYTKNDGYNIGFSLNEILNKLTNSQIYITSNITSDSQIPDKYYIEKANQRETIIMYPGKVVYDHNEQEEKVLDILSFIDKISEAYFTSKTDYYEDKLDETSYMRIKSAYFKAFNTAVSTLAGQVRLFKKPVFMQDEEYRIIFDINQNLDVVKYRQLNGVFMPYIEVGFDVDAGNKSLPINSITIGPKNNLDIAEKGIRLFAKSLGYQITKGSINNGKLLLKKSEIPLRY